jgi:hypothetical protein
MPHMADKRYAVVSCHVERPLEHETWRRFSAFQAARPGGFRIAALMRPPSADAGEDEATWLARANEAARHGPLGHHTHWGGPATARPQGGDPAARVREEAAWLRERGLEPGLFCGGGWYSDAAVAAALAELGYADCTPTAFRPSYLAPDAPRVELGTPAWLTVDGGRLLALPTTHSLGMAARTAFRVRTDGPPVLHVYFHDTDLLVRRRAVALSIALGLLGRRRTVTDLERLADQVAENAPEVPYEAAARPGARRVAA